MGATGAGVISDSEPWVGDEAEAGNGPGTDNNPQSLAITELFPGTSPKALVAEKQNSALGQINTAAVIVKIF